MTPEQFDHCKRSYAVLYEYYKSGHILTYDGNSVILELDDGDMSVEWADRYTNAFRQFYIEPDDDYNYVMHHLENLVITQVVRTDVPNPIRKLCA